MLVQQQTGNLVLWRQVRFELREAFEDEEAILVSLALRKIYARSDKRGTFLRKCVWGLLRRGSDRVSELAQVKVVRYR